jgi:hypothetical protein
MALSLGMSAIISKREKAPESLRSAKRKPLVTPRSHVRPLRSRRYDTVLIRCELRPVGRRGADAGVAAMKKPPYVFLLVVVIVAVGVALITWIDTGCVPGNC